MKMILLLLCLSCFSLFAISSEAKVLPKVASHATSQKHRANTTVKMSTLVVRTSCVTITLNDMNFTGIGDLLDTHTQIYLYWQAICDLLGDTWYF